MENYIALWNSCLKETVTFDHNKEVTVTDVAKAVNGQSGYWTATEKKGVVF